MTCECSPKTEIQLSVEDVRGGRGTFAWRVEITKACLLDRESMTPDERRDPTKVCIKMSFHPMLLRLAPRIHQRERNNLRRQFYHVVICHSRYLPGLNEIHEATDIQITNAEKISFVCPASFRMDRRSVHEVHPIPGDWAEMQNHTRTRYIQPPGGDGSNVRVTHGRDRHEGVSKLDYNWRHSPLP